MGATAIATQYAAGWAALAALFIAVTGVAVSAWFTVRSLRRATDQYTAQRQQARADKLRFEIIDLTAALAERPSGSQTISYRIGELANKIDPANPVASRDQLKIGAKALISGEVSSIYRRIYSHAIGILMLTDDEAVAGPVRRIMAAAEHELAAFGAMMAAPDTDAVEHRGDGEEQHAAIQGATLELVNYGLQNLRGVY